MNTVLASIHSVVSCSHPVAGTGNLNTVPVTIHSVCSQRNPIAGTENLKLKLVTIFSVISHHNPVTGTGILNTVPVIFTSVISRSNPVAGTGILNTVPVTFRSVNSHSNPVTGTGNLNTVPVTINSIHSRRNPVAGTGNLNTVPVTINSVSSQCDTVVGTEILHSVPVTTHSAISHHNPKVLTDANHLPFKFYPTEVIGVDVQYLPQLNPDQKQWINTVTSLFNILIASFSMQCSVISLSTTTDNCLSDDTIVSLPGKSSQPLIISVNTMFAPEHGDNIYAKQRVFRGCSPSYRLPNIVSFRSPITHSPHQSYSSQYNYGQFSKFTTRPTSSFPSLSPISTPTTSPFIYCFATPVDISSLGSDLAAINPIHPPPEPKLIPSCLMDGL